MRIHSLRGRIVAAGVVVVALVVGGLDAFVYLSLRQELHAKAEELLSDRAELVRSLARDRSAEDLATRVQQLGIRSVIRAPDGEQVEVTPASQAVSTGLPAADGASVGNPQESFSQVVDLPGGGTATVFVSSAGIDRTLDRTLFLLVSGTLGGVALAALVLRRWTADELRPLEDLIQAAHRVAGGARGVRLRPARTDNEIGHVSLAFDEVTEALEEALDRAQLSSAKNQAFLADAAHQLRTPITGIRAAAEVLSMDLGRQDRDHAVQLLVGQTERVGQLLSGLLRMAKLDLCEPPVQEAVDLETICRTEVDRARPLSPDLEIALECGQGSEVPIELDPTAMGEALSNLLDNARRHAKTRVDVRVAVAGSRLEIRVGDDGPGLDPADAERVFERFVSLDGDGGSGLGLPIARAIVEANGGDLVYEDSRFVIRVARERRRGELPRRRGQRRHLQRAGDRRRSSLPDRRGPRDRQRGSRMTPNG